MLKTVKRITAGMMVTGMILTGFAGCSSGGGNASGASGDGDEASKTQKDSGMVTLNLALLSPVNAQDAQMVNDAVNEVLAEKYGLQVKITFINTGSWTQQTNLLLTGDEVDVLPLYGTPLTTFVNNGQVICLDDYYNNSSEAMKAFRNKEAIDGTRFNGKLYSITNMRNNANQFCVTMSEQIVSEMEIDVNSIHSLDDLEPILYEVHEKYPDIYTVAPQNGNTLLGQWSWDGLGDEKFIGVLDDCGQSTTVQNLFETDDFQNFCSYTRQWYEDGLIMPDVLSNTESGDSLVLNGKAFCYLQNSSNAAPSAGTVRATVLPAWAVSGGLAALSYGINANSRYPDESWQLIEIMYTDPQVSTLLIDGIEGVHYVKNEDGTISYPEGLDAMSVPYGGADMYWAYPNGAITPPLDKNGPTFWEDLMEFNDTALISIARGCQFDMSGVADAYTACSNVMDKYYKALMSGTMDPETTIPQAVEELESAGIQEIIDLKQEQLDAFLAQKQMAEEK